MTDGCIGSTAVMDIAEGLHQAANISFTNCEKNREVFDDIANGEYELDTAAGSSKTSVDDIAQSFETLVDHTSAHGSPLMVKEQSDYLLTNRQLAKFVQKNGKAAIFLRTNLFDLAMCDIRDGIGMDQDIGNCDTCHEFRDRAEQNEKETSNEEPIKFHHNFLKGLAIMSREQERRVNFFFKYLLKTRASPC